MGQNGLSRRELMKRGAVAGGVLATGGLLAACGGGGGTAGSTTQSAAVAASGKKGGVLRVGVVGSGPAGIIIPNGILGSEGDVSHLNALYNMLWNFDHEAQVIPVLAEGAEPNAKGDVWTVELKKGVEFHNGKTMTAKDVMFSLELLLGPKSVSGAKPRLEHIDLKRSKIIDDNHIRFQLHYPYAPFEAAFVYFTYIMPVGFDPKNPVGTGPFKYKSWSPGQTAIFDANENYWGKGPYVDQLQLIEINDASARVNALLADQIDLTGSIPALSVPKVEGGGNVKVMNSETGVMPLTTMRVDTPPFDDVKVRQAVKYLISREQVKTQALSDYARVANDLMAPYDPFYASDIPQREQDIEKGTALLKQAGQEELATTLVTCELLAGMVSASQVLEENMNNAGTKISLKKVEPGVLYGEQFGKWPFAVDWFGNDTYFGAVSQAITYNETGYEIENPQFQALYKQARSTMNDAKRKELVHGMQELEFENGGFMIATFPNQLQGYSTKLTGMVPDKTGVGPNGDKFEELSFT